jgi:predicted RNA binding protein YcfA (HicA-like mRNA interferase family)
VASLGPTQRTVHNHVPRLKCTFREFIAIIEAHGFALERYEGSHRNYIGVVSEERRLVTVAPHSFKDEIKPETLASMIRQSGLSKKLFRK